MSTMTTRDTVLAARRALHLRATSWEEVRAAYVTLRDLGRLTADDERMADWQECSDSWARETGTLERSQFVQQSIDSRPREVECVRRLVASLEAHGHTVTHVNDGDEQIPVAGVEDVLTLAFNLDELTLITSTGSGVYLIMGEFPDTVSDWGVSLDDAIRPVTDWAYSA